MLCGSIWARVAGRDRDLLPEDSSQNSLACFGLAVSSNLWSRRISAVHASVLCACIRARSMRSPYVISWRWSVAEALGEFVRHEILIALGDVLLLQVPAKGAFFGMAFDANG